VVEHRHPRVLGLQLRPALGAGAAERGPFQVWGGCDARGVEDTPRDAVSEQPDA